MNKPHARLILTDLPSKDSVHGIVVYDEECNITMIQANSRLVSDFGVLGIHRGVDRFKGQVRVSESTFDASTKKDFARIVKQMCEKYSFDTSVSLPDHKFDLPSDRV
jgi:hypothetical protein